MPAVEENYLSDLQADVRIDIDVPWDRTVVSPAAMSMLSRASSPGENSKSLRSMSASAGEQFIAAGHVDLVNGTQIELPNLSVKGNHG